MPRHTLIACLGNILLGDDGFGVEVARRLEREDLPEGTRVTDYGIRGMHLAYDLAEGWDATILVDAAPQGGEPGTVYVIEPERQQLPAGELAETVRSDQELLSGAYTAELAAFVDAVATGGSASVTGEDARASLEIALAAAASRRWPSCGSYRNCKNPCRNRPRSPPPGSAPPRWSCFPISSAWRRGCASWNTSSNHR